MAKRKYVSGSPFYTDKQAQIIGHFLDKRFPTGGATPDKVLTLAKNPDSEIHDFFEWDNRLAAHQYRLQQARKLISCVCIVEGDGQVRGWLSVVVAEDGKRSYEEINKIASAESLYSQVIAAAAQQLFGWRERYRRYTQFFNVVSAIDAFEAELKTQQELGHGEEET